MKKIFLILITLFLILVFSQACQEKKSLSESVQKPLNAVQPQVRDTLAVVADSTFKKLCVKVSLIENEISLLKAEQEKQISDLKALADLLTQKELFLNQRDEALAKEIRKLQKYTKLSYTLIFLSLVLIGMAIFLFWQDRIKSKKVAAAGSHEEEPDEADESEGSILSRSFFKKE